jgi:hypothetical protein
VNRILTTISVLCGLITALVACSKKIEKVEPCRILEFTYYEKFSASTSIDTIIAKFSYDNNNNPTSIIFNKTTTGRPNYIFKYDEKGRLINFYGVYPTFRGFDFYAKYIYDGDQIVSDSVYISGSDTSDLKKNTRNLFVGTYEYDSKLRIIKYTYDIYFPMNPSATPIHQEINFSYNADGNLVNPPYTYDNKVNFLSTNSIFQFINRDYSANNAIPATAYNNYGLPLTFDFSLPQPFNRGRFLNTGASNIVYSCGR